MTRGCQVNDQGLPGEDFRARRRRVPVSSERY